MTTNTIEQVQELLNQAGVRDVKFLFDSKKVQAGYTSTILEDVAEVFARYLAGETTEIEDFSDEVVPVFE